MNKIINITLGLSVCIAGSLAVSEPVHAQKKYWDVPTRDHLEVSLMSLKERARKISDRNEWLKVEMYNLEQEMVGMEQDFEDLQKHNNMLGRTAEEYDRKVKDMSLVEKRILRANMSTSQLQSEYRRITAQLELKEQQEQELKQKIGELTAQIEGWRDRVQTEKVEMTGLTPEISRYQVLVEESKRSLVRVEQEHRKVMSIYERPMQDLLRLRKKEDELADELGFLQDELEVFNEEKNILENQIEDIGEKRQDDLAKLESEIKDLAEQKSKLDAVLVKAENRIKTKNIDFSPDPKTFTSLTENLDIIKNENLVLQEEMTSLQKALQKINSAP